MGTVDDSIYADDTAEFYCSREDAWIGLASATARADLLNKTNVKCTFMCANPLHQPFSGRRSEAAGATPGGGLQVGAEAGGGASAAAGRGEGAGAQSGVWTGNGDEQ